MAEQGAVEEHVTLYHTEPVELTAVQNAVSVFLRVEFLLLDSQREVYRR